MNKRKESPLVYGAGILQMSLIKEDAGVPGSTRNRKGGRNLNKKKKKKRKKRKGSASEENRGSQTSRKWGKVRSGAEEDEASEMKSLGKTR
jgi:hypothetical protein